MLFIFVFALFLVLRSCFLLIYGSLGLPTTFLVLGVRLGLGFSPENSTFTNIDPGLEESSPFPDFSLAQKH